jgi:hypothetical protein
MTEISVFDDSDFGGWLAPCRWGRTDISQRVGFTLWWWRGAGFIVRTPPLTQVVGNKMDKLWN